MEISFVVSCPHFTAAVAHGHQVGVELEELDRAMLNNADVRIRVYKNHRDCAQMYPKSLQGSACSAVIHGHRAVRTPREDVLVIGSQANDCFTVGAKAPHQRFSSFEHRKIKTRHKTLI